MQAKLHADNIHLIADLQKQEENELLRRYGSMGQRLARLSKGQDHRRVESSSGAKSVSTETTFNTDKSTPEQLIPVLRRLAESVSKRLKSSNVAGQTVVLKLKTADFKSRTRNTTLPDPTQLADRMFSVDEPCWKRNGRHQIQTLGYWRQRHSIRRNSRTPATSSMNQQPAAPLWNEQSMWCAINMAARLWSMV